MKKVETSIQIAAPPEAVWAVLADVTQLDWNPLFGSVEGPVALGEPLKIRLRKPRITLRTRVTALEPGRLWEWRGHPGIPGLVDGCHVFELTAADGGTRLRHDETFTGWLLPMVPVSPTRKAFEAFNLALKAEVERRAADRG